MTLIYPRTMPTSGPASQQFDIQRVDYQAPTADGRVGGVQAGFPLWIANWTLARLSQARSDEWIAWMSSMRGAQRRFLAVDYSRPFPRAYWQSGFAGLSRSGGGAFTGSASGWSQTIDSNGDAELTLNGLPAGLVLNYRDLIGFKWDADGSAPSSYDRRTLMRVTDPGTANGSGSVTVIAEPPLPAWMPAGAIAHLDSPACVMALVTSDTQVSPIDRRLTAQGTKISGIQDIRP